MPENVSTLELLKLTRQPPRKVAAFFRRKGYAFSWSWRDLWQEEHARAFTVAKAAQQEVLEELRRGVKAAFEFGWSERRFLQEMTPALQKLGWWGKKQLINPAGNLQLVQLGSPWRLKTIYRTNLTTAFSRGRYAILKANQRNRPIWVYDALNDGRTRESHRALDNRAFPAGHPIWDRIYPPNGFNCRCMVRAMTLEQAKAQGIKVEAGASSMTKLPDGFPDEGWSFNPGAQTIEQLAKKVELRPYRMPPIPPPPEIPPTVTPPPDVPKPKPAKAAKAKPAPKRQKLEAPESFEADGRAPERKTWFKSWRDKGVFKAQRLERVNRMIDDPAEIKQKRRTAFYRSAEMGISMKNHVPTSQMGRAVMRHEWGHYLDDKLARLAGTQAVATTSVPGAIARLLGAARPGSRYVSSFAHPIGALTADAKRLRTLGARVWKRVFPGKRARVFDGKKIDRAWYQRRQFWAGSPGDSDVVEQVAKARKTLEKSDALLARVWKALPKSGRSMVDDLLFAEALETNDLSFLLSNRGEFIRGLFGDRRGDWSHFSDLIGAITKETVGGRDYWGWGHLKSYYKNGGIQAQATEAFANMVTLEPMRQTSPLIDELVRELVPDFSKWFDELLDGLNAIEIGG